MTRGVAHRLAYGLLSAAVLGLDQVTKVLVTRSMPLHASLPVVPDLFHLTLVTNRGALFGVLHDLADPYRSVLFTLVPILAIGLILFFQIRTTLDDVLAHTGLGLILGGAVGNLIDRLRFGHVIDFLDVFVGNHHWPAFNVADSAICIGVSLLMIGLVLPRRHHANPEHSASPQDAPRPF